MLDSPKKQIKEINNIFGKLGFNFVLIKDVEDSITFYKEKLNMQIYNSQDIYPECNLYVKFTNERLQFVKNMISKYVTEYSKIYDISKELNQYQKLDDFIEEILKSILGSSILFPLEKAGKYTYVKSVCNNEFDLIAKKIFENPYFQDKIIVEENFDDKNTELKGELKSSTTATFEQVFQGDLNFNFYPLTEREKEQILNRSENIINIKFQP